MEYTELWLMILPLAIAILIKIIINFRATESITALKYTFKNKKKDLKKDTADYAYVVTGNTYAMMRNYLAHNAFAVFWRYRMDSISNRKFVPTHKGNYAPEIDTLCIMKSCMIGIDAIGIRGEVTISKSAEYKEIISAKDSSGEEIFLRDNLAAPYYYSAFFNDLTNENGLMPRNRFAESKDLFYQIIVLGKDVTLNDEVPGVSAMREMSKNENFVFDSTNHCYVVKSPEEAFHMVDIISKNIAKQYGTFDRDDVISSINFIQRENKDLFY